MPSENKYNLSEINPETASEISGIECVFEDMDLNIKLDRGNNKLILNPGLSYRVGTLPDGRPLLECRADDSSDDQKSQEEGVVPSYYVIGEAREEPYLLNVNENIIDLIKQ